MKFPGYKKLTSSARWLRSRFVHGGLVLGYHRVAETTQDTFSMCVTPDHFVEHLQVLSQFSNTVDLRTLANGLRDGQLPRRAVALTFDDGYADVLYNAKPLLESLQIQATAFVVPDYLGREFWWDELARLLLFGVLPAEQPWPVVGAEINQCVMTVSNRQKVHHNLPQYRLSILHVLYERFRGLPHAEREPLMRQLRSVIDDADHCEQLQRALTQDEVIQLSSNGLITIGVHTMTHADLPNLPKDHQKFEILQSKAYLEEILEKPVDGFAYPHSSYSPSVESVVCQAGFLYACAGLNDIIWQRSNHFQLPRFWIPDWNGDKFASWLRRWLN